MSCSRSLQTLNTQTLNPKELLLEPPRVAGTVAPPAMAPSLGARGEALQAPLQCSGLRGQDV